MGAATKLLSTWVLGYTGFRGTAATVRAEAEQACDTAEAP